MSDVVLSRLLPEELSTINALGTGRISGALTETDCVAGLTAAGFGNVSVDPTQVLDRAALEGLVSQSEVPACLDVKPAIASLDGVIRSAAIRAVKPGSERRPAAPVIRVFEPALCCTTGVSGIRPGRRSGARRVHRCWPCRCSTCSALTGFIDEPG